MNTVFNQLPRLFAKIKGKVLPKQSRVRGVKYPISRLFVA